MRKRKKIKRYQLKRKYKKFSKAQMERKVLREFYLITEKDANMMSLYLPPLTKTDKLFDEVFPRNYNRNRKAKETTTVNCCLHYAFQMFCHCEPVRRLVWQSPG